MQKSKKHILVAFILSWLVGIACLFIALQFSPPRWSIAAMDGAIIAAAKSSILYVLPPLLFLVFMVMGKRTVSIRIAIAIAFIWTLLTVAWWASSFSPIPWRSALRNVAILLPGPLIPAVVFSLLLKRR